MKTYAERLAAAQHLATEQNDISGWWFAGILVLVALCAFIGLDRYGLFDVDEAIFAQATQEMLSREDIAVPTYNDEPRYHKPPLTYWSHMVVNKFGVESPVLMSRIASTTFGFLTVIVFFMFLETMTKNTRFATLSAGILGLNWLFIGVARGLAPADAALNFFMLCTTMALIANIFSKKPSFMTLLCAGLLCAMGLLTKGPVAIILPGIIVFLVAIFKEQPWFNIRCANPLVIGPIAAIGVAPWAILLVQHNALEYLQEFWLTHNWARYTSDLGNSNSDAWWFYIPVFLLLFVPWSLLLPSALIHIGKDWWRRIRTHDALTALPAIGLMWMVVVIAVFSFSDTKLVHYILFAFPGAALLLAGRLQDLQTKSVDSLHLLYIIPIVIALALIFLLLPAAAQVVGGVQDLGGLLGAILGWFGTGEVEVSDEQLVAMLGQDIDYGWWFPLLAAILAVPVLAGLMMLCAGKQIALIMLFIATTGQVLVTAYGVMPIIYQIQQGSLERIALQIEENYRPGDSVYFVGIHAPSVRLISGVPFIGIHEPRQILTTRPAGNGKKMFVFEQENQLAFSSILPSARTACSGGFCLAVMR